MFIMVTEAATGAEIHVNINTISHFLYHPFEEFTTIHLLSTKGGTANVLSVKETPEDLRNMIKAARAG